MAGTPVEWTEVALDQLNDTFNYWHLRNKSNRYNQKLMLEIDKKLNWISKNHNTLNFFYRDNKIIRVHNYFLVFALIENKIFIKLFWYARQKPSKLIYNLES